ncbi:hypothetical protein N7486_009099 [Penicillium sp. IBT 16267x]|nr:hypothetical protein N7486_009099 [Penicillium sp. IBT 16267x]
MSASNHDTTDVVICGCGPTGEYEDVKAINDRPAHGPHLGAMLSAYLGRMKIPNIVLEREMEITTDPRGIALDEDGNRLLQGLGLYSSIYTKIGTCMKIFKFIGGTDPVLDKKGFVEMDYGTTEGGTGHVGFICHKQPALEQCLRDVMAGSSFCDLRSGCEVIEIAEEHEGVSCRYRDPNGEERQIKARFLVGADGKTGFTRKRDLEPRGIVMEQATSTKAFYEEVWVALNWKISLPTETTHPEFPLWSLGYTPEQVYDLFFPSNFRFLCNPNRPSVCGRFGIPSDRLWRFEFVVLKDEDGDEMSTPEIIKKVVFPYITHPGTRYGLSKDVAFPEDCMQVLRCRPFNFSARSCNRWSDGRVILCGDAAHVFPPFGGQGIASGFRDAIALAWRLALLCRVQPQKSRWHEDVLSAWYEERKQQLERSLAATIANGKFVSESNPLKVLWRTVYFWFMHMVPSWRDDVRRGQRKDGMVRYENSSGKLPFLSEYNGGVCLPQVYCKAAGNPNGDVLFTDDVIFGSQKQGLLQLVVYLKDVNELPIAQKEVMDIDDHSNGEIQAIEATFLIEDSSSQLSDAAHNVFRLATGDEFKESPLCEGRPTPQFYDPLCLAKELMGRKFVIVRPDRFIFAACHSKEELWNATRSATMYLSGEI